MLIPGEISIQRFCRRTRLRLSAIACGKPHTPATKEPPLSSRTANESSGLDTDQLRLLTSSDELLAFVRDLPERSEPGAERRKTVRIPVNIKVICVPLNGDEEATGDPFVAVSRDISTGGLALVYWRRIPTRLLSVWLPSSDGETLQLVVRIVHCRGLGKFIEHCCQIVKRVEG